MPTFLMNQLSTLFLYLTIWFGSNTKFTNCINEMTNTILIFYYEQTKWSKVLIPALHQPFISVLTYSAVHCSVPKTRGRSSLVWVQSATWTIWMRTGTSLCTDLSPSTLDVDTCLPFVEVILAQNHTVSIAVITQQ